jgi:hypothetical protein
VALPIPVPPPFRSSLARRLPRLPPLLATLPGADQRRRALQLAAAAGLVMLLRPWPPFLWLPGWCVGLVQLAAVVELLRWLWWPRRWR